MRPPKADLETVWEEQRKRSLAPEEIKQKAYDMLMALKEGIELIESTLAHVSHGGPTRADAEAWLKKAKEVLEP